MPSPPSASSLRSSFGEDSSGTAGDASDAAAPATSIGSSTHRRVEVNQRALIFKILARYASENAVYRELLANSNDAEATVAEIYFTTEESSGKPDASANKQSGSSSGAGVGSRLVTNVVYRNNGMPFRTQDWERLCKIAEGNPDPAKVGAFGVGSYTLFSICDEPMVVSGDKALMFTWGKEDDSLWTKTIPYDTSSEGGAAEGGWTSFVLPVREPEPLPDSFKFGQFLCSCLAFTDCLTTVRVYVNNEEKLVISKELVEEKPVSLHTMDGLVTATPKIYFTLDEESIALRTFDVSVSFAGGTSSTRATYCAARATSRLPEKVAKEIERVTHKPPPSSVTVGILKTSEDQQQTQQAQDKDSNSRRAASKAARMVRSLVSSQQGSGRIFIGFKTSQTTGMAAHVAAPFIPTVEREAIDLQDATLKEYNLELLCLCGMLMRVALEQSMARLHERYLEYHLEDTPSVKGAEQSPEVGGSRAEETDGGCKSEGKVEGDICVASAGDKAALKSGESAANTSSRGAAGSTDATIAAVAKATRSLVIVDFPSPGAVSPPERSAILLMKSFCPRESTPQQLVGSTILQGFAKALGTQVPPVLTRSGIVPGDEAKFPFNGLENIVVNHAVRSTVINLAKEYYDAFVTERQYIRNADLVAEVKKSAAFDEGQLVGFLHWCLHTNTFFDALRDSIRLELQGEAGLVVTDLSKFRYYNPPNDVLSSLDVPMPADVLPKRLQEKLGRTLPGIRFFLPLDPGHWVGFAKTLPALTDGKPQDDELRLRLLAAMSELHAREGRSSIVTLRSLPCIPVDPSTCPGKHTTFPHEVHIRTPLTQRLGLPLVSVELEAADVSPAFLLSIGVRSGEVSRQKRLQIAHSCMELDTSEAIVAALLSLGLDSSNLFALTKEKLFKAERLGDQRLAPISLFFPREELRVFPSVPLLRWTGLVDENSEAGRLLSRLGVRRWPPLEVMLKDVQKVVRDKEVLKTALDTIFQYIVEQGVVGSGYSKVPFVPCISRDPLLPAAVKKYQLGTGPPCAVFLDKSCLGLGFKVLDTRLSASKGHQFAMHFHCKNTPTKEAFLRQFSTLVVRCRNNQGEMEPSDILEAFNSIYTIMETHASFPKGFFQARVLLSDSTRDPVVSHLLKLRSDPVIPCLVKGQLEWRRPREVLFKSDSRDDLVDALYCSVDCYSNNFLKNLGVRETVSEKDLLKLVIASPSRVLEELGSTQKYLLLLKRIAARFQPSWLTGKHALEDFSHAAFLLACERDGSQLQLKRVREIHIIDNGYFGRLFPVCSAPRSPDLEEFYTRLGVKKLSEVVSVDYSVQDVRDDNESSPSADQLRSLLDERGPLLVSSHVTSRLTVKDASTFLRELVIREAGSVLAHYSLRSSWSDMLTPSIDKPTTCCIKSERSLVPWSKQYLYVTKDFDWFDLGLAIGPHTFSHCNLEDALFIESILTIPLEKLKDRGFPVDRIMAGEEDDSTDMPGDDDGKVPGSDGGETTQAGIAGTVTAALGTNSTKPSTAAANTAAQDPSDATAATTSSWFTPVASSMEMFRSVEKATSSLLAQQPEPAVDHPDQDLEASLLEGDHLGEIAPRAGDTVQQDDEEKPLVVAPPNTEGKEPGTGEAAPAVAAAVVAAAPAAENSSGDAPSTLLLGASSNNDTSGDNTQDNDTSEEDNTAAAYSILSFFG